MVIDEAGRVGIGTDNPLALLHIQEQIDSVSLSMRGTGTNNVVQQFCSAAGCTFMGIDNTNTDLTLGGTLDSIGSLPPTMTVQAGGRNVGIGTTTPITALHVSGTLRIADGGETPAEAGAGAIRYNSGNNSPRNRASKHW